jgi:hypothetical protein
MPVPAPLVTAHSRLVGDVPGPVPASGIDATAAPPLAEGAPPISRETRPEREAASDTRIPALESATTPALRFAEPAAPPAARSAPSAVAPPGDGARDTVANASRQPASTQIVPVPPPPALPPAPSHARRAQPADEGPVVVVNIGRIEVRALTAPAPPAPPPARRPAAVSLEEYLKPKRRDR